VRLETHDLQKPLTHLILPYIFQITDLSFAHRTFGTRRIGLNNLSKRFVPTRSRY